MCLLTELTARSFLQMSHFFFSFGSPSFSEGLAASSPKLALISCDAILGRGFDLWMDMCSSSSMGLARKGHFGHFDDMLFLWQPTCNWWDGINCGDWCRHCSNKHGRGWEKITLTWLGSLNSSFHFHTLPVTFILFLPLSYFSFHFHSPRVSCVLNSNDGGQYIPLSSLLQKLFYKAKTEES